MDATGAADERYFHGSAASACSMRVP